MELKDWISSSVSALAILVSIGVFIMQINLQRRQKKADQEREEQQRKADQEREEQQKQIERVHQLHIQLGVDCRFYGPEDDYYLVEFLISAHNKGHVQHKFKHIYLRVRGIEANHGLSEWQGNAPRIAFPQTIINNIDIIPTNLNFLFIEPEVEQMITYVTRLPSSAKYILVHVLFEYDKYTPHTIERVFQIK